MERPGMTQPASELVERLSEQIATYLSDPCISDICINAAQGIFVDRGEGLILQGLPASYTHESLKIWILNQLSAVGKSWDARYPFVDGILRSGHRVHVVFPPLASGGILISLRRPADRTGGLHTPISRWQSSPLFSRVSAWVHRGDSVIISGATGSGKTTLASDLLGTVCPTERIIALEDTPELHPQHPHFLSLVSRPPNADGFGEITLRTLLRQTLRMRPDRIVLGECRGPEVLDLLQALNTGHRGALATLHANHPRDALRRIELLCHLASGSIPSSTIRELLSLGIQWVVQVARSAADRQITQAWQMMGREGDTLLLRPVDPNPAAVDSVREVPR